MIVPIEGVLVDGPTSCTANVFGHRVPMRCAAGGTPAGGTRACLRETALRLVDPSAPGVRARIATVIYQGGHFRVEAIPIAAPEVALHLVVAEPCSVRPGDSVNIAVDEGWIIPVSRAPIVAGVA